MVSAAAIVFCKAFVCACVCKAPVFAFVLAAATQGVPSPETSAMADNFDHGSFPLHGLAHHLHAACVVLLSLLRGVS